MDRSGALTRAHRLEVVLARDGATCVWCGRSVGSGLVAATTEHLVPKVKGGPSWIENELAACRRCNAARGHVTPAEWLNECERRGWQPRTDVVTSQLEALLAAIARQGGQRRARDYAERQLRRLRKRAPL